jgi:transcriptional regulator with XRE-family HTH domain
VTFPEYIERKYLEWQNNQGKRKSIDDFAVYIGISQPTLSMWMSGKRAPGIKTINLLADIFGNEVYDALGLPRPNPHLQTITRNFEFLSEEKQARIAREIAEEAAKYEAKKKTDSLRETSKPKKT